MKGNIQSPNLKSMKFLKFYENFPRKSMNPQSIISQKDKNKED